MQAHTSPLLVFSQDELNHNLSIPTFKSDREIYFIAQAVEEEGDEVSYLKRETEDHVIVIEPHIPAEMSVFEKKEALENIVARFIADEKLEEYSIVSDTPKALPIIRNLHPKSLIYNCVRDYTTSNPKLEQEMITRADVVLNTGHVYLH